MMMYDYLMVGPIADDRELAFETLQKMNFLKGKNCPIIAVTTSKSGCINFIYYEQSEEFEHDDNI